MPREKTKVKRGFMDCYNKPGRKHDVTKDGYGNAEQWKSAFSYRMGFDEAKSTLGDNDPVNILGISDNATMTEIKSAWRKYALKWHPDKYPPELYSEEERKNAENMFKQGLAAYTILCEKQ